jgi:hypothetical protein
MVQLTHLCPLCPHLLQHLARSVPYVAMGTERLKHCTTWKVWKILVQTFYSHIDGFWKELWHIFHIGPQMGKFEVSLNYKTSMVLKCCHMHDPLLKFSRLSTACEIWNIVIPSLCTFHMHAHFIASNLCLILNVFRGFPSFVRLGSRFLRWHLLQNIIILQCP